MSHHQPNFTLSGTARIGLSEAELDTFGDLGREISAGVDATIARYLAAGDGWREAGDSLCGAFAPVARIRPNGESQSGG